MRSARCLALFLLAPAGVFADTCCRSGLSGGLPGGSTAPSHRVATNRINAVGLSFIPEIIEVTVGTEVTWSGLGGGFHPVFSRDNLFAGENTSVFSFVFTNVGAFGYVCGTHEGQGMTGLVLVSEAPATTGAGATGGATSAGTGATGQGTTGDSTTSGGATAVGTGTTGQDTTGDSTTSGGATAAGTGTTGQGTTGDSASGGASSTGTGATGSSGSTGGTTSGVAPGLAEIAGWELVIKSPQPNKPVKLRESALKKVKGTLTTAAPNLLPPRFQDDALIQVAASASPTSAPQWRAADRIAKANKKGIVKFSAKEVGADLASGGPVTLRVRASTNFAVASSDTSLVQGTAK